MLGRLQRRAGRSDGRVGHDQPDRALVVQGLPYRR